MKKIVTLFAALFSFAVVFAAPKIIDVTAQQRTPKDGKVDVAVTLSGTSEEIANLKFIFSALDFESGDNLSVTSITQDGVAKGSGTSWTLNFVWNAKSDIDDAKITELFFIVRGEAPAGGVQLWEDGPYFAECNVGANNPEEAGYYFWWGDTVGYKHDGSKWNAVDGSRTGFSFRNMYNENPVIETVAKSNSSLKSYGWIDSNGKLTSWHDAATVHIGTPWRMPTWAEFDALMSKCDTIWTTHNGVSGRLVKGRGAYSSKSIFLPAAGDGDDTNLEYSGLKGSYWSAIPDEDRSRFAWRLLFDSDGMNQSGDFRYHGLSVRPVHGAAENVCTTAMGASFAYDGSSKETDIVPMSWLKDKYPEIGDSVEELEAKANETAANGHKVWECYLAGEDPTDANSKFAAEIVVGEEGKPSISWNPDLGEERTYKILGSTDLKTWVEIPEGHEADYNFFKVTVEMK